MATYWVEISLGIDWLSEEAADTDENLCSLSASQYKRAMNVQIGDILLHHVNGAHCWAGYSHVIERAKEIPEPQTEEDKAYPFKLSISQGKWLNTPEEFFITRTSAIPGLSHDNWHRQGYVRVKPTDAELIMKAVNDASGGKNDIADIAFKEKLKVLRDANASKLCKQNAHYICQLCGGTLQSWCDGLSVEISTLGNSDTALGWFVHAHHIKRVAVEGNADLNNLLRVCPNCHQMVKHLDEAGLRELQHKLQK